ncbi:unnamed protein product [Phytomonas sp. Hart1]|nr:unnamed protein product [Phytomonas sp. Hart1]|eukprot:CCW70888.1 unnamed protein product [Phytomonas sp. isolate Hart1]
MFGIDENEAKALSNEYNFGPLESENSQTNLQRDTNMIQVSHHQEEIKEEDSEAFSPKNTGDNMQNCAYYYNINSDGPKTSPKSSSAANIKNGGKKTVNKLTSMMAKLGSKAESKVISDEEKTRVSLERRWKRTLAEEERLNELERRLDEAEQQNHGLALEPNFPPRFLCLRPVVYYSLDQVPDSRRRVVYMAYWNWIALIILLVLSAIVSIAVQYTPLKRGKVNKIDKTANIIFALLSLFGIPLSFFVWFWPVYRSCSTGNPSKYHMTFLGLTIALAHALLEFFGPLSFGMSGIILSLHISQSRGLLCAIPVVILLFLWLFESIVLFFIIIKIFIFYRKDLDARRILRRQVSNVVGL